MATPVLLAAGEMDILLIIIVQLAAVAEVAGTAVALEPRAILRGLEVVAEDQVIYILHQLLLPILLDVYLILHIILLLHRL